MKKILSVFLALAMVLSLSVTAFAAEDTSHDVNVNYTSVITGLAVTGNSSTTDDGRLVFADDDMMKVTVSGKNLDIATVANKIYWGNSFSLDLANTYSDYFTISEDGSTATFEFQYNAMSYYFAKNYQMYYTNDGGTLVATGIYIYCEEGYTAHITGMEITSGATYDETSGIYNIAYGSTNDVVIKVNGTNLDYADDDTLIRLPYGTETLSLDNGWTFSDDNTSATKSFAASTFYGCTTVFTVQYSIDGTTFSDGLKVLYESVTVGVDIEWGKMSFTYAANEWTAVGNTVTVSTSNENVADHVDVSADFTFNDDASDLGITYDWDVNETTLSEDKTACTFTLNLSGKPNKAFDGTVGTVKLTIAQGTGLDSDADDGISPQE